MLEIIVWMLAVIIVMQGVLTFQIGVASVHHSRDRAMVFGLGVLLVCVGLAWWFVGLCGEQVQGIRELMR